jgi:hypothetical protein
METTMSVEGYGGECSITGITEPHKDVEIEYTAYFEVTARNYGREPVTVTKTWNISVGGSQIAGNWGTTEELAAGESTSIGEHSGTYLTVPGRHLVTAKAVISWPDGSAESSGELEINVSVT